MEEIIIQDDDDAGSQSQHDGMDSNGEVVVEDASPRAIDDLQMNEEEEDNESSGESASGRVDKEKVTTRH